MSQPDPTKFPYPKVDPSALVPIGHYDYGTHGYKTVTITIYDPTGNTSQDVEPAGTPVFSWIGNYTWINVTLTYQQITFTGPGKYYAHITGQSNLASDPDADLGWFSWTAGSDFVTPTTKYSYDGSQCVLDPNGTYGSLAECQAAHPIVTPPPPPPPSTGQKVSDDLTKLTNDIAKGPASWNINDIASYVGTVGGDIGQLLSDSIAGIWDSLPDWFKTAITDFDLLLTNANLFFTKPGDFYRKHSAALWESGSPSSVETYVSSSQQFAKSQTSTIPGVGQATFDIGSNIQNALKATSDKIKGHFTDSIPYDSALTTAFDVSDTAALAVITATALNLAMEFLPTENFTGLAFLTGAILDTFGIGAYTNDVYRRRYEANIGRQLDLVFNDAYRNRLPSIGELERLINIGKLTAAEWELNAPRATGITVDWLNKSRLAKHQVPGFADMIQWNLRHPDQLFDINGNGDLLETNMLDWGKYFLERQYTDPSLIAFRTLVPLGLLTDGDFTSFLTRRGYRKDVLPGQSMSDFDMMFKYLHALKEPALEKTALASTLKLYLAGSSSETDLQTAASKVYSDTNQLNLYMTTAKNDLAVKNLRPKHFTYTLLIKMAEAGQDTSAVLDEDLAATGFDQTHQSLLKEYIQLTIAAKKQSSTTSSTTSTS